jgi:hypothetical protein
VHAVHERVDVDGADIDPGTRRDVSRGARGDEDLGIRLDLDVTHLHVGEPLLLLTREEVEADHAGDAERIVEAELGVGRQADGRQGVATQLLAAEHRVVGADTDVRLQSRLRVERPPDEAQRRGQVVGVAGADLAARIGLQVDAVRERIGGQQLDAEVVVEHPGDVERRADVAVHHEGRDRNARERTNRLQVFGLGVDLRETDPDQKVALLLAGRRIPSLRRKRRGGERRHHHGLQCFRVHRELP